jgi:transcriptional regulator with XRE-family HTH domain
MVESRIATSLRAARERRGWSREALAYHAGVSWSAVVQIESGRRQDIRLSSLSALATALGVSVDHLIGGGAQPVRELLSHRVLFYATAEEFLAGTVPYLREGVERSEPVLAVAGAARIELLREALGAGAAHVEFVESSQWYRAPAQALAGCRDYVRQRLSEGASWIRLLGEPVWAGRSRAERLAWARYESLITLALAGSPASIVCTYDQGSSPCSVLSQAAQTHAELTCAGSVCASSAYRSPEEFLLAVEH